jgi:hypothetical protein
MIKHTPSHAHVLGGLKTRWDEKKNEKYIYIYLRNDDDV